MSYKRITEYINDHISRNEIDKSLQIRTQIILDIGVVATKKAEESLRQLNSDITSFSGRCKITLQNGRDILELPDHIKQEESLSDQDLIIESYVKELLKMDNLIVKLETNKIGGIFKWLSDKNRLLLITVYKIDINRQKSQNSLETHYPIHLLKTDQSTGTYYKPMMRLIYHTIIGMKQQLKDVFDAAYRRFLDHEFRPFEDFLYNERLSIRNPKYRPTCSYRKRIIQGDQERAFLEIQDPPRQITEGGNSVVPISEDKNKKYLSARVSDYDEFERLLVFNESYRIEDWPEIGRLYLEGDLASNLRKWNAIKQLKSRGLSSHARLADVLIRPWGLPKIKAEGRTYYNRGISHDLPHSQPQAKAVDIALSTPDVALIHGPPGTGKTTVIVEIIRHVIAAGGRVMMCAPTHVAVDNVLERTANIRGISAVRIGGRAYMDRKLQKYRLQDKAKSIELALPSYTPVNGKDNTLKELQMKFANAIENKGKYYLENLAINQANLVCGTTIGIARFKPPDDKPVDFDILIIDEASKATLMEFLVPAVRAKKWILVGDHRQLPPYVNEQEIRIYVQRYFEQMDEENTIIDENDTPIIYNERTNELIASLRRYHEEMHALGEGEAEIHWRRIVKLFNYARKPIKSVEEMVNFALGSCFHYFLQRVDESRNARLIVQHRMPSILANFLDEAIYNGQLKTSETAAMHGLKLPGVPSLSIKEFSNPLTFISTELLPKNKETPGKYKGYFNTPEAEVIAEIISSFVNMDVKSLGYTVDNPMTIGIITYYVGQSREINRKLRTIDELKYDRGWRYDVINKPIKVRVSIVDRFQGQEQDIVILSMTRSNDNRNIGFLKNLQRINVSLSRAKQNLIIVGNADFLASLKIKPTPIVTHLARYCKKHRLIKYAVEEDKT